MITNLAVSRGTETTRNDLIGGNYKRKSSPFNRRWLKVSSGQTLHIIHYKL